ncbi:MAG TPA: hypothetical protein VHO25_23600, partial [Polyangiaceae bacterium]|nr:hypothetical protein [Polyangiaceae bacterium]
ACFRALGLALGEGSTLQKAMPSELLTALYEEQRELLVHIDRHTLPQPRISHREGDARLQLGAFYLAALAISAELPERGVPKHPVLHPWAERVVDARFDSMLTCISNWLQTLRGEQEARWRRMAVGLVDRLALHSSEGAAKAAQPVFVDAVGEPHELEWPSLLLRELKVGALNPVWLERLQRRPDAVANIRALCGTSAEPWQQLATRLWELWHGQGMPEGALRSWCAWGDWFWPATPVSCLLPALARSAELGLAVPFAHFTTEHWQYLRERLPEQAPSLLANATLWMQVPLAIAWHWLLTEQGRGQLSIALPIVWQRDASWAIKEYDATLQRGSAMSPVLVQLLAATPVAHGAALIPWLKTVTSKPGAAIGLVDAARQLLHQQVAERAAGFREAYSLLDELERRGRRITG